MHRLTVPGLRALTSINMDEVSTLAPGTENWSLSEVQQRRRWWTFTRTGISSEPQRDHDPPDKNRTFLTSVHVRNTTVCRIRMANRSAAGSEVAQFSYSWSIHVTIQVTTRWKELKHIYQIAIATVTCFVFKFHWPTFHCSVLGFILPHILSKKVSPTSPIWSTCSIKRVCKSRRVRGYRRWSPTSVHSSITPRHDIRPFYSLFTHGDHPELNLMSQQD